ncbi:MULTISPECIES: type I-C CRISPR-associated endonuclease Cas1c [Pelosinus]|uniref:CRISPR-associated endonuclease Cas1 n=1 Tax=Pelosinus fermentans B4 TaxID=1149862 RepID=I9LIQ6_9FIRM|nr:MULTISPECIES: type I-C CRISPR-associated endonuclease Cas1c [Pelosinus]EIW20394.1 CRISPR-associated protein Cas1 [Pelosinus fermentans B4]EIW25547.1 CRISPR-associated protein Cas1 [Pelosinus fermentans A11]OAM93269.1 CRISPR-associated protein Cas1 [Pelosinus fermentans DSM 17108]SDQ72244.1 CRISPR-associated protein, Cas1 family [Pelosinus fermentans]
MRRLLNTLYVTLPDVYLACDGENVLIKVNDEIKFRVPVHNLEGIVCFGFAGASPRLMHLCCERGVAISFLSQYGKFMGRITGNVSGNVLLRRTQYRWSDDEIVTTRLSRRFIAAKIMNSRAVLHRVLRDHTEVVDNEALERALQLLARMPAKLEMAHHGDSIRGIEGEAAHLYFSNFNQLVLNQKEAFRMLGRNRRPPTDRVNALLSFLYTLLTHEVVAALESVGLDPQVGFLHRDRPGRPSLALDVMEELRPHFVDRLAVTLINRNQITAKGFVVKENGAVIMDDDTRKEVLTAWQKRKQEEITHPYLEEKIPLGLVPYVQAMLLARHMRGDLEDYPPFFWK